MNAPPAEMNDIVIPPLGPLRPPTTLPQETVRQASGLVVSAVRHSGTPMTHIRLRIPSSGLPAAAVVLLTQWLFRPDRLVDGIPFGERAADCGAGFSAAVDVDNIQVTAQCLTSRLTETLHLLAGVLVDPTLATSATERDVAAVAHMMRVTKSRPGLLALEALNAAAYGAHPYAAPSPNAAQIMATSIDDVEAVRRAVLRPAGTTLVVVGDRDTDDIAALAHSAFAGWSGSCDQAAVPAIPEAFTDAARWHHVPGAVRASVRAAMRVPSRTSASYAQIKIANLVLGGYFSSRLIAELRERRGLCYSVRSTFAHTRAGSVILISAEVDGSRAAEGLCALRDVVAHVTSRPITADEHAHARRYAVGSQYLAQSTPAELADWVAELAQEGAGIDWLRRHALDLADVDLEGARSAAQRYIDPGGAAIGLASDPNLPGSTIGELHGAGIRVEVAG